MVTTEVDSGREPSEETKAYPESQRQRRREEIRQEKPLERRLKGCLWTERVALVERSTQPKGRRSLRAKQAWWLADQLDMLFELFGFDYEGGYLVYKDKPTGF